MHPTGALLELGERLRRLVAQPARDTLQPGESLDQRRLLLATTSAASCCLQLALGQPLFAKCDPLQDAPVEVLPGLAQSLLDGIRP